MITKARAVKLLLALQATCIGAFLFVPFGFDHPSSWGLDFDHLLLVVAIELLAMLAGVVVTGLMKRWWLMAVQILVPVTIVVVMYAWQSEKVIEGVDIPPTQLEHAPSTQALDGADRNIRDFSAIVLEVAAATVASRALRYNAAGHERY